MSDELKTRILFVDDEPMVLEVLQLALKPLAGDWEMAFVESGEKALNLIEERPVDVIVSDMCMPGMTGAQLVNEVRKRHPATIRLILSAHSDEEMVMKCLGSAHQFLTKPFNLIKLKSTLNQIYQLKQKLKSDGIRRLVTKMDCLPSMPVIYFQILDTLQKPDCSLQQIAEIVARDPGLTTKLLQLVNSAFFGFATKVSTAQEACMLLGVGTIRSLALTLHLFSAFDGKRLEQRFVERVWKHSLKVGGLSKKIAQFECADERKIEQSFTAGLLHDVGKLILAGGLGESYVELTVQARDQSLALTDLEQKTFDTNHADVGAYLLDLWGLPLPLVEAVAFHHQPAKAQEMVFGALTVVHVANALANELESSIGGVTVPGLDLDYLALFGLQNRINSWRSVSTYSG